MAIIDEPSMKPMKQRLVEGTIIASGITAVGFFLILITLAIWYYVGNYFLLNLTVPSYVQDITLEMLRRLLLWAIIAFLIMFAWARYNIFAFSHKARRVPHPAVQAEEIALRYALNKEEVEQVQQAKIASLAWGTDRLVLCDDKGNCIQPINPAVHQG